MILFLDTKFLDKFSDNFLYEKETRNGYLKLDEIFSRFTEIKIFINISNEEEFLNYENACIERLKEYNSDFTFVDDIFSLIKTYKDTLASLAFVEESNEWCEKYSNGNIKISNINIFEETLLNILNIDRKFDLSVSSDNEFGLKDWKDLKYLSSYTKSLIITDQYILNETAENPLFENIIEFGIDILGEIQGNKALRVFTKLDDDKLEKILNYLKNFLEPKNIKVEIVKLFNEKNISGAKLHDRYGYGAFFIIEVGSGFALFKKGRFRKELISSTSRLRIENILDRQTYVTWKSHNSIINKYYKKVNDTSIVGSEKYCFS